MRDAINIQVREVVMNILFGALFLHLLCFQDHTNTTMSALKSKMNVQSFPRPPKLEKISRHIRVTWEGKDIAETKDAYWVLETHHPPSASSSEPG